MTEATRAKRTENAAIFIAVAFKAVVIVGFN